jgi:hypothetical protein
VESHALYPLGGFPAESFFDVYVEVDLPPCGAAFPGATVYNPQNVPLLVFAPNITSLPPRVVYIHGNSTAVPVLFLGNDPGGLFNDGDLFGYLILAGHGMDMGLGDEAEFLEELAWLSLNENYGTMGLPTDIPAVSTYGLILLGLLLLVAGFVLLRKRSAVSA